ncbi:MAG: helix-turn-helix domain-containing protein [Solirubrobacteraceae bacterium]
MKLRDIPATGPQSTPSTANARALEAFSDVGAALDCATGLDDVLRVIARKARALAGVARCSIYLRDDEAGVFRGCLIEGGNREQAPYVKRSVAGVPADGMTCEVLRTREPVIVADAQNDPRVIRSNARFWNIRSMLAIPMLVGDSVIGVIYLDDVERPHSFDLSDAKVVVAFAGLAAIAVSHERLRAELSGKLDEAERRVNALRRAAAIEERLSELVLAGAPLEELLAAVAEVHGKPAAVYDAEYRRLAVGRPPGADCGVIPELLEPPALQSPAVAQALAKGGTNRVFVVGPLHESGLRHRHLVAPIVIDGELRGWLVMMEHRTRFNASDTLALRRTATLVALQVSSERRAVEADWEGGASLAAELLSGAASAATAERRAARLGVGLDVPRIVAAFGTREQRVDPSDFRSIASLFTELAPHVTVQAATLGETIGALVAMPDGSHPDSFPDEAKQLVAAVCEASAGGLVAGVSSLHTDHTRYPEALAEARQVLDCICSYGSERGPAVVSARDLGLGRVFLASADPKTITTFASTTFGALVDDLGKRDLLATLSLFFENMANIRTCAVRLGVHENTIRYRLARLEELTGLAITHDPDAQLGARLSLLVLMLNGSLTPGDLLEDQAACRVRELKLVGVAG